MTINFLAFKSLIVTMTIISPVFVALQSRPLELSIKMPYKNPKALKDLLVKAEIKSNEDNITIPKNMVYGFMDDSSGFLNIQLQEDKNGIYTEVKKHNSLDDIPFKNEFDTLKRGSMKEEEFTLGTFFHIYKRSYRMRVLGFFSIKKHWIGIYSNWVYFQTNEDMYKAFEH